MLGRISDGTTTHAALKLDISDASLTHSFIPNIKFYATGIINALASKSQAGEGNTGRVWVWLWENRECILHQNAFKAQYVNHRRTDCEVGALVYNSCTESPSFVSLSPLHLLCLLSATDLVRPLLFLTWATGTAWLSVLHINAWVIRATSLLFWVPWSPQTLEPVCLGFTPFFTTF